MPGSGDGSQRCPDASEEEDEEELEEEQQVERCPICLGVLPGAGLAMPDSCTHLFCLECLLTWAESQTVPSCPVDRRPFHNVYMWDHPQGCVQVPVRKRASQPESERCLCRSPEPSPCLKSKQGRRVRRQSDESDAKSKGLVRKCSDEDPASINRKKVRGTRCPVWVPAPLAPIQGSLSQDLTDPLWLTEELARGPEGGQCKRQLQDCPWLGSAAPIPANGPTSAAVSRQRFPASNWNQCPFQSPPVTFDFSFAPSFGLGRTSAPSPGHFVFQGRVCAVTCPKGGDKRGGRASGSKAPPKQAAPSRRSGRNSRSQEEAPLSDPGSSPPSPPRPADSDSSSSGAPPPPGRTAQGPGKRKGRKAPTRKTGKKGKGPGKGKASAPVLSSPSASEEEEQEEEQEEGGGDHHQEKEADAEGSSPPRPAVYSDSEHSDAEGSPEMRPLPSPGSPELPSHDAGTPDETEEPASPPEEKQEEEPDEMENKEEEEEESHSLPASSPPHSPGDVFSRDNKEEEEEEEVPVCSPGSEGAYSPQGERNARLPSGSPAGSPGSPPSPGSDSDGQDQTDAAAADVKRDTPTDEDPKEARDPSPAPETAGPEGGPPGEKTPEDEPSPDDTNVVPMDCSSPSSQPVDDPPARLDGADPKKGSASPGDEDPPASPPHGDAGKRSGERERSQERKNGRQRRTRFHSPSSTWAGKAEGRQDPASRRSRSPATDGSPPRRSSRPRSRERERERERDPPRRDRSRERKRRRSRSRSRSRSKSRSRSRSRTRAHRRGSTPDRPASRERSPPRGERGRGTAWRGSRGGDSWRGQGGGGNSENGSAADASPERPPRSRDPDWVAEQRGGAAPAAPWEGGSGWRGGVSERGRGGGGAGGGGQGGCNRSSSGQQGDSWGGRKNFPGAGNGSGGDAYSRFNENRGGGGRRKDMGDPGDSMLDRSGWSSASSWAVRKTLPADVQDYYSRRDRGGGGGGAGGGGWNRTDEEPADPFKSDTAPQAGVPGNAPGGNPPLLPLPLPHPPQTGLLHNPYTAAGQRGAPPISLQPAAPYAMAPQVPVHMHSAVPHFQAPGAHGLPPPPPPPPPMHHGGLTAAAAQPDGHGAQMSAGPLAFGNPPQTVTQTKVGGPPPPVQTHPLPTSTTLPGPPSKARGTGDGSQKEKKQQIQERAVNEVKNAIKPYYQKKEITKDEYKEIVRKAVEKVCHSRSGEVNSSKVANLVKAYVDKYKHARKK